MGRRMSASLRCVRRALLSAADRQTAGVVDLFRPRGPYAVAAREDFVIDLSSNEHIESDLFLSERSEKSPLVILMHGFDSSKKDHTYQALHLASWGMHSLAVQLPNKGPWVNNGKTLAKIVRLLYGAPKIIDNRFDINKIVSSATPLAVPPYPSHWRRVPPPSAGSCSIPRP